MERTTAIEQYQNKDLETSQRILVTTPDSQTEISVYSGKLTKTEVARQSANISQVFPKFPEGMIKVLKNRFIENKFTDSRLIAAVSHVIDNYTGYDKLPNIADFIKYDKKMKIFNFHEAANFGMKDLKCIDIGFDTPRWAYPDDVKQYKIKEWIPTNVDEKAKVTPNNLKLSESDALKNAAKVAKEINDMLEPEPTKPKMKQFSKKEKAERLEKFKKEHGIT